MQIVSTTATAGAPRFRGGIEFAGAGGKFAAFTARSTGGAYGNAAGYSRVSDAVRALTLLTIGVGQPAAGIFERDGRFYGRALESKMTFSTGKVYVSPWRLEQHPGDADLITGKIKGTVTRTDALRWIVDGAQRINVSKLPVA